VYVLAQTPSGIVVLTGKSLHNVLCQYDTLPVHEDPDGAPHPQTLQPRVSVSLA
jgi:hypothetical protein